VELNGSCRRT